MRSLLLAATIFISSVSVVSQRQPITIFLAGDSTMAMKQPDKRPETGWGEMLQQYFEPARVRVDDRAMNGRSTKTFIGEGRWQAIVDNLKKGDYVFVQFGHNDESKEKGERYTPPEDYRNNLIKFVEEVRDRGGRPILLTPVVRRKFDSAGNFVDTHGGYPDVVRRVAKEQKVPLIDMHRKSETLLRKYGPEDSRRLFLQLKPGENPNYPNGVDDNTHFSPFGAEVMAKLAVEGIRENKLGLRKYLK
jgi:lysophospholipase L1-like esterase